MEGLHGAETEIKLGIWAGSTGELFTSRTSRCPTSTWSATRGRAPRSRCTRSTRAASPLPRALSGWSAPVSSARVEYARERETFGQEIGRYQLVQDMIAQMVLGYETSKLLVCRPRG